MINDTDVANVVMEVEDDDSRGILSKELLIMIKLMREKTANSMATINFQLVTSENRLATLNRFPDISDLSPTNVMDTVLVIQKIKTQRRNTHI